MASNTSTIGQLPPKNIIDGDDLFEIQGSDGLSFNVTSTQISNLPGLIPIQLLRFVKVIAPSNPPLEEGVVYLKEIDSMNNGLFVKIKKSGIIVEKELQFV